jgi:hypothetical protein
MKRSKAGTKWFLTYRDLGPPSLRKGQSAEKPAKEKKRKPRPDWDVSLLRTLERQGCVFPKFQPVSHEQLAAPEVTSGLKELYHNLWHHVPFELTMGAVVIG